MRLVFAAALAMLLAAPALAGNASTIAVGLVVTGNFASPLLGSWHARTAARGAIYHFVVSGSSGKFYQLVSPVAGECDLRVSGVIYSLEPISGRASGSGSSYEMQYAIQSAEIVASPANADDCEDVAASYLSDMPAGTNSLVLSRAGDGRLIDSTTGAAYIRTR